MSVFLVSALRAIVEMLGLCLLGQGVLYVLAGKRRSENRIYQLFALITNPPRRMVAALLPGVASATLIGCLSFAIVLALWLGLAFIRKFL